MAMQFPRWRGLIVPAMCLVVSAIGCRPESAPEATPSPRWPAPSANALSESEVNAFCGNCHAMPQPSSFRRRDWSHEVSLGYTLFYASKRTDLNPPPLQRVIEFYQARAPEAFEFPALRQDDAGAVPFTIEKVNGPDGGQAPGVSSLISEPSSPSTPPRILLGDMSLGDLYHWSPTSLGPDGQVSRNGRATKWGVMKHPCGFHRCDLNGDGTQEWIAGDLGSFLPADHDQGKIEWFPAEGGGSALPTTPVTLSSGRGRVADVRPSDIDRDGDQDLLVAEFGWRETGKLAALENLGVQAGRPQWKEHLLDPRHGAIHVIPAELNGDSRPDFVALFAQEHEAVVGYLASGDGPFQFEKQVLFAAQDPTFGSSGIELVDLDGDQDLDVVLTNGDAFDSGMPKPYHGVHWLENEGKFPFTHRRIAAVPGVHRAVAGDIDGDGDLDLACCALLPGIPQRDFPQVSFPSVLWLEQRPDHEFVAHVLESGHCRHAACVLADLEPDGDLDLVVGEFALDAKSTNWLTVFRNGRK